MDSPGTPPPADPEPTPRWPAWLAALAVALLWSVALVPGGPSYDDLEGVADNPLVNGERSPVAALTTDYWSHRGDAGHLRPLAIWSLALDHRLYGDWWPGFHLTGILLHAAVVGLGALLLLRLARELGQQRHAGAWVLGLTLAACHPALADAVAWVSGRTSTMAILPGLVAAHLVLALPRRAAGARPGGADLAAALLAGLGLAACLLGKEDGYVALAPLGAALLVRRRLSPGLVGCALGLAAWLALRTSVYGTPLPEATFAPLAGLPLGERLVIGGRILLRVPVLLLLDPGLDPGLEHALANPGTASEAHELGWALWLGAWLLVLGPRRLRGTSRLARVGLATALLAWLPYQGWLPAGELLAPRFLYLPLLCAGPWLGEVLVGAALRVPRPVRALGATTLLLVLPTTAWHASRPYGSLEVFHRRAIERAPWRPEAWNGLGLAREAIGDRDGARAAWGRAVELSDDGYGRAHSNLGRLALEDGDPERALGHFERAAELGPRNPVAWANLGRLRLDLADAAGSAEAYGRATSLAPGLATAWRGLCKARLATGDRRGASEALDRATELAPDDPRLAKLRTALEALP